MRARLRLLRNRPTDFGEEAFFLGCKEFSLVGVLKQSLANQAWALESIEGKSRRWNTEEIRIKNEKREEKLIDIS